jgi:hypothetical protein
MPGDRNGAYACQSDMITKQNLDEETTWRCTLLTSLEAVFPLDDIVHDLVVLTRERAIDQVCKRIIRNQNPKENAVQPTVAAHDTRHTRHHTPHEGMRVDFVLSPVVHI